MTPDQRRVFVNIAQMGVGCGLTTPEEWLLNYTLHQTNFELYEDIPRNYDKAIEAYAAFWRGAAGSPEEAADYDKFTDRELIDFIYRGRRFTP